MDIITEERFRQEIEEARKDNIEYDPQTFHFGVPSAKETLMSGLRAVIHHDVVWLPEYDKISEWLSNNHKKGLMIIGPPGVGKTVITMKVIPMILHISYKRILSCFQSTELVNRKAYEDVMHYRNIVIDDVGIEGVFNDFGNPHVVFSEIVDAIEKRGVLLIATSNLTIEEIKAKYGLRTYDRLRAHMTVVVSKEKSVRGI